MPGSTKLKWNANDLKKVNTKLSELMKLAGEVEVQKTFTHVGRGAVGRMRTDAPVDTGRLRREIAFRASGQNLRLTSEALDPDSGKDYAPLQEHGFRHTPARPYFWKFTRWAVAETIRDLQRKITGVIQRR